MSTEQQPMPTVDPERVDIQQIVINEIHERWRHGREEYKTGLQVGNGRDMARDALEEAQDLLIYMTGVRERDAEIVQALRHLRDDIHRNVNDGCLTCVAPHPCHTATDLDRVVHLLVGRRELP